MPETLPARPQARALTCTFLGSADRLARCPPDDEPEVAFVGRSNAGKSSTLNRLCGRAGGKRALARVSKTPGRTRLINFFTVEGGGRLVDLPGYGFASASKAERDAWNRAIDDYLHERSGLRLVVVVMDARRPLQPMDRAMIEWCMDQDLPVLALLNKADKLKAGARKQMLREVRAEPGGTGAELFSAVTGLGVEAVLGKIRGALSDEGPGGGPPTEKGEDAFLDSPARGE